VPAPRKSSPSSPVPDRQFFPDAPAFRRWLEAHATTASELRLAYYKVASGRPSLTWPESIDEALCFGWIDGVRRSIDAVSYEVRFTPRRPGSIWSAVNIDRVSALTAAGRMTPAGLAAFALRDEARSRVYSFERKQTPELNAEERARFRKDAAGWRYFEALPPGYRRTLLHWITSAKLPATRARRLERFITACRAGKRIVA
jgi:uncharacterized protein YdeI (YjbR/CyaY-like superfamily)